MYNNTIRWDFSPERFWKIVANVDYITYPALPCCRWNTMRRREYTRWRSRSVTPWTPASSLASLRTSTARTSVLSPSWWHVSTVHQPHPRSTLTSSSSHPKKLPLPALLRLLNVVKEDYNSWRVVLFGLVWICWDRNQIIEFLWNSEVCGVGVHLRNTHEEVSQDYAPTHKHTHGVAHIGVAVLWFYFLKFRFIWMIGTRQ